MKTSKEKKGIIDHTFAICAYKESEFLEECILSLVNQTVKTNIIMATSTPNDYIKNLANKYQIPLFIRNGKSDIRDDWNFAYDSADTEWVTIAHQDDRYNPAYVEEMQKKVVGVKDAIAFVSDYVPIKNGKIGPRDINSKIRKLLRTPLKYNWMARSKFWKKKVLSLGNSICCPAVTYRKSKLGNSFFTSELKFNIDWDTFYKISEMEGAFLYVDKPLTYYRVHDGATSKEWIVDHKREKDDIYMFRKFWPNWLVNIIMHFYKKAYETYG
jgi:glycosyltransferase involved in cell wall biosynthesis